MAHSGTAVDQDLPGLDRPASVHQLMAADDGWLKRR
jgi:hypothetical protein